MADLVSFKPKDDGKDEPFRIGSTVCLRSGGAVMTVRRAGKQSVIADWTDGNDNLCTADFPPAMLRHADPDEEETKPDGAT